MPEDQTPAPLLDRLDLFRHRRQLALADERLLELEEKLFKTQLDLHETPAAEAATINSLVEQVRDLRTRVIAARQFRNQLLQQFDQNGEGMDFPSLRVRNPQKVLEAFREQVGQKEDQFINFYVQTVAPGDAAKPPDAEERLDARKKELDDLYAELDKLEAAVKAEENPSKAENESSKTK